MTALRGSVVGLDSAPLIYFVEQNSHYLEKVRPFFQAVECGEFQLVTSTVTLVEVLVHPLRLCRPDLMAAHRDLLLKSPNIITVPVDEAIAEHAALLRAAYRLKTPDAIQLATAIESGASWFLTNDLDLPPIPGLSTLVLDRF